jgi:hypothetical protein
MHCLATFPANLKCSYANAPLQYASLAAQHPFPVVNTVLQTCNVTPLLPGDTLKLHNADACEAAVYSTTQQLYALLLGLLELAEIGGAVGLSAAGWSGSAAGAGAL